MKLQKAIIHTIILNQQKQDIKQFELDVIISNLRQLVYNWQQNKNQSTLWKVGI